MIAQNYYNLRIVIIDGIRIISLLKIISIILVDYLGYDHICLFTKADSHFQNQILGLYVLLLYIFCDLSHNQVLLFIKNFFKKYDFLKIKDFILQSLA